MCNPILKPTRIADFLLYFTFGVSERKLTAKFLCSTCHSFRFIGQKPIFSTWGIPVALKTVQVTRNASSGLFSRPHRTCWQPFWVPLHFVVVSLHNYAAENTEIPAENTEMVLCPQHLELPFPERDYFLLPRWWLSRCWICRCFVVVAVFYGYIQKWGFVILELWGKDGSISPIWLLLH